MLPLQDRCFNKIISFKQMTNKSRQCQDEFGLYLRFLASNIKSIALPTFSAIPNHTDYMQKLIIFFAWKSAFDVEDVARSAPSRQLENKKREWGMIPITSTRLK